LRARVLSRIGRDIVDRISPRAFDTMIRSSIDRRAPDDELRIMRDLDSIRAFLSGSAVPAFFDLPWMPLYVTICFLFHPAIGWLVLIGALLLCSVTYVTEVLGRGPEHELRDLAAGRRNIAETARRNAEFVQASGMRGVMAMRWGQQDQDYLRRHQSLSDIVGGFGSFTRMFRMILQSTVLALGAYLVINQQATAGVMLAATILSIRALAPVELVIANWRGFVAARQGLAHLSELLVSLPQEQDCVVLPRPARALRVTSLTLATPGTRTVVLHDVSFSLDAGQVLGVIGPTGSGKSSLTRALVGAWKPARGVIRLDGARLDQWKTDMLGTFIGYLPQQVELFEGTVAQNISRFQQAADGKALMRAAHASGVHDIILRMPNGYQSQVGEGGALLAGGQRQRVALARALYGDPFLLVLDEPNANLDADGEAALAHAIQKAKHRGAITVVVTHRPSILAIVDSVLVLNEGRAQSFGPRAQVIAAYSRRKAQAAVEKPAAGKRRSGHVQTVA
jgi:ATP-binding cassette subfamily C protein